MLKRYYPIKKDRLVKCYKYKINFTMWEDIDEAGKVVYQSSCPYCVTHSERERKPRCNGLDEFGQPCVYAVSRAPKY